VIIETGRLSNVLLIPLDLIQRGGVWVYKNGEAHFKKIEIVGKNDKFAGVKGIEEGEKILVPDPHKKPLFEGADVRL